MDKFGVRAPALRGRKM